MVISWGLALTVELGHAEDPASSVPLVGVAEYFWRGRSSVLVCTHRANYPEGDTGALRPGPYYYDV